MFLELTSVLCCCRLAIVDPANNSKADSAAGHNR